MHDHWPASNVVCDLTAFTAASGDLLAFRQLNASQYHVQTHTQSSSGSTHDADAMLMLMLIDALADSLGLTWIWMNSTCVDPASVCS